MSPAGAVGAAAGPLVLSGVVGRGTFTVALDLRVDPGEVVALMGPNGAGKSTVVRTVAGLEPLRSGRLALGERLLDGAETTRPGRRPAGTVAVPVAARRVGTVFQDHRLFPHLTALGNVAFGPHSQGIRRRAAESTAQGWLDRLGVGALASRRPHELSGGQAQRVAVARALAAEPAAVLLDEPLAALDAQARGEVQRALAEHLRAFAGPCLLVTHDLVDALVLADRIVVLEEGRVVQVGTPGEVMRRPATPYVASLLGVNLVPGPLLGRPAGHDVAVRPSAIRLTPVPGDGAGAFAAPVLRAGREHGRGWTGTVAAILPWGEHLRVEVDGDPGAVVEMAPEDLGAHLRPGTRVLLTVDPAGIEAYPSARR